MMIREKCQCCKRRSPLGFSMSDELWAEAVPPLYREGVLCIFCFDRVATARGVDWSNWPIEWWPVSGVAANVAKREIGAAYESGLTAREISANSGLSQEQVYRILKTIGIARRRPGPSRPRTELTEREQAMIALYDSGKTLEEVGIAFGVTRERIRQILVRRGTGTRGHAVANAIYHAKRRADLLPQIIERFDSGQISASALAHNLGTSPGYVINELKRAGIYKIRQPKHGQKRRTLANDPEMIRLYQQTETPVAELAKMFGFKNEASCRMRLFQLGARRRSMTAARAESQRVAPAFRRQVVGES